MDLATVVEDKHTDDSISYNVEVRDENNKTKAIIGCIDENAAYELGRALNAASWVDFI